MFKWQFACNFSIVERKFLLYQDFIHILYIIQNLPIVFPKMSLDIIDVHTRHSVIIMQICNPDSGLIN